MKKTVVLVATATVFILGVFTYIHYYHNAYLVPALYEQYPLSMGQIACDDLIRDMSTMPDDVRAVVDEWVTRNRELIDEILTIPTLQSKKDLETYVAQLQDKIKAVNDSKHNYIFEIPATPVPLMIKISGVKTRVFSIISSLGYDPYKVNLDEVLTKATSTQIPTQQHITRAATHYILNRLPQKEVMPIPTYLYHLDGRPRECDDKNFIIVQQKLVGFQPLSALSPEKKRALLNDMDLKKWYDALKFGNLWNISEDTVWVREDGAIAYPNGEKPDNEGFGKRARWKVAILGHDLNKAKHNIRNWHDGGHRAFEVILERYTPERVEEWMAYYRNDPSVAT